LKEWSLGRGEKVLEMGKATEDIRSEIPALLKAYDDNPQILNVIKEQKFCSDNQRECIGVILENIDKLQEATTRDEQNEIMEKIDAGIRDVESERDRFDHLTERFRELASTDAMTIREGFMKNADEALENMKEKYPKLAELSKLQLEYVAKSQYIRENYADLLKKDPDKFVDKVCERAQAVKGIISKNGTFVEIKFCEAWSRPAAIKHGALMHPKLANAVIKQGEVQVRKLKVKAEKEGRPEGYYKCYVDIFSKQDKSGKLQGYETRVDLGDGGQTSLLDHLEKSFGKESEMLAAFSKATREQGAKEKIAFNDERPKELEKDEAVREQGGSVKGWEKAIDKEKTADKDKVSEKDSSDKTKTKGNNNKERN